jgi:uncharacterized damage-inducible protein DinB
MQAGNEFIKLVSERYSTVFERCLNVIDQLNDDQIWFRPTSKSNSIGIIIQHLTGNLNQWICEALGGYEFQRNRPQEFVEEKRSGKEVIVKSFSELEKKIQEIILKIKPEDLLNPRHIQGYDVNIMTALFFSITHFELHYGQIAYIAKMQLNEKYQEQWRPITTVQK